MSRGPESAAFAVEALDFAPDLLAIQERPPGRAPMVALQCVVLLVALLVAWAAFAKLDIIASAEGRLVPAGYTKVVQPADAGIVSEILVEEGAIVRAGQPLLRLDPGLSNADVDGLSNDAALKRLTIARIDAELADRPFAAAGVASGAPRELLVQVESQYRSRRQAFHDAMTHERQALNKARADLAVAEQVRAKLAQTLPSFDQVARSYQRLLGEGFVGELAAAEKQREAAERAHDLRTQTATVASLQTAIAQSEAKVASLASQYRSQLDNERVDAVAQLNRIDQELRKSRVKSAQLEIRAPVSGVVKDLTVTTRGAVVAAGALLMNIVPVGQPLQAEVSLKNEDAGFTATGQSVRLKVAAYPFQKYGLLDGTVGLVAADAMEARQGAAPAVAQSQPLGYRALVQLATPQLRNPATGEVHRLQPGMVVVAEIHQGERTVLEYLLSPIRVTAQEAARER